VLLLEELETEKLRGGHHEDVGHRGRLHGEVLEDEIIPLFSRGGEPHGSKIDEDSMALQMRDVVEAIIRRRRGSPGRAPTGTNCLGKRGRH
jgi:hypothetical protein